MNENCKCAGAGFCTRHHMHKTHRMWQLCRGVASTEDGGLKYVQAWERGDLGAVAPEDPWDLDPESFNARPKGGVGTELTAIFSWFGDLSTAGCSCKQHAEIMDAMGPAWCRRNFDQIVGWCLEAWDAGGFELVDFIPEAMRGDVMRKLCQALPNRTVAKRGATYALMLALRRVGEGAAVCDGPTG